nr:annexin A13-like [Ipomoea batatas]
MASNSSMEPYSTQTCENICKQIHASLLHHRLSLLSGVLDSPNRVECQRIREKYKEMYGEDPVQRLQAADENEPETTQALAAVLLSPHERDAAFAREALRRDDVDFRALAEIFTCRKSSHVQLIHQAYVAKFRTHLDHDIATIETPCPYQKILMALSASHKAHNADISQHIAKCDARRLYQSGEGRSGGAIDEAVVLEILSKRSIPQLNLTFSSYNHIYGHTYTKSLKDGCLGEFEDALLTIVKCICSPSKYFAQMLYTCLNGRRVDKGGLVRIMISRAEIDLDEIQLMFKNKHGLELKDAICESIPQGDYREFLVMLATKPSKRARLGSL